MIENSLEGKKKYLIANKPCKYCGGLISWEERIENGRPIHLDETGEKLGAGSCPRFSKQNKDFKSSSLKYVNTEQFNRFKLESKDIGLPLSQGRTARTTRFYIAKLPAEIRVHEKLIELKRDLKKTSIYGLANKLVGNLFKKNALISFYRIQEPEDPPHKKKRYLHLYVVELPHLEDNTINPKIISGLEETFRTHFEVINEDKCYVKVSDHLEHLKKFFDAMFFKLKDAVKSSDFEPYKSISYDTIEDEVYYYIDLGAKFYPEERKTISYQDRGKVILGELMNGNLTKYRLLKTTDWSVERHPNDPEYQEGFIPYVRKTFFESRKSRQKPDGTDWTMADLWKLKTGRSLPRGDTLAVVTAAGRYRAGHYFYPQSKLYKFDTGKPPKLVRVNAIQTIKTETLRILHQAQQILAKVGSPIKILPLLQLNPQYFDLMSFPFCVEFANNKEFPLNRSATDPYKLVQIPQEVMKNDPELEPLAGSFNFLIIPIIPANMTEGETRFLEIFIENLAKNSGKYKIAKDVKVSDYIPYTWDEAKVLNGERNVWASTFKEQIAPALGKLNQELIQENSDYLPMVLMGFRDLGNASDAFKRYMENSFYHLIKTKQISSRYFTAPQGFLVGKGLKTGSITYKTQKLPLMFYRTILYNIACNHPDSEVALRVSQGIIFRSKYPFGAFKIDEPIKSLMMIAGFDASQLRGEEHSEPRGAAIVMIDPYGKQVKSDYIENALTHKGIMSEKSIRQIIELALKRQESILRNSYIVEPKKLRKGTLEHYFSKDPSLPRKILFIYDGNILKQQKRVFLRVYSELAEIYDNMPEIIFLENLKSHEIRNYLEDGEKVFDMPFGVLALLNNREFLITKHILGKSTLIQPAFYRFKMRLRPKVQGYISTEITKDEIVRFALQLFQTAFFNTGKSGRPLKWTKVIHESHKLSQEYAGKPDSINVLWFKE